MLNFYKNCFTKKDPGAKVLYTSSRDWDVIDKRSNLFPYYFWCTTAQPGSKNLRQFPAPACI